MEDGALIANGPMAISEGTRIMSKYGNNAVPGGTALADFNAGVSFSNGNVSVTPPSIEVGGNPKDTLFRMLLKKHGGEVATDISN
jgi:hypothetical protein